jgi:hypothetical protein
MPKESIKPRMSDEAVESKTAAKPGRAGSNIWTAAGAEKDDASGNRPRTSATSMAFGPGGRK